ncbi:hypothetical protein D9M69_530560 [compost metagenome]
MHHAHHGRDDAQRRQRVAHAREAVAGHGGLVADGVDLVVHEGLDLVRVGVAADDQAQVVAQEHGDALVRQDGRVAAEDLALLRRLHVGLELHHALLAGLGEQLVQQRQQVHVELAVVLGRTQQERQLPDGRLDGLAVVARDECAERGAADHEQLHGLEQHAEMPAHEAVAAEDGADHHQISHQNQHALPLCPEASKTKNPRRAPGHFHETAPPMSSTGPPAMSPVRRTGASLGLRALPAREGGRHSTHT